MPNAKNRRRHRAADPLLQILGEHLPGADSTIIRAA
jgi:hypothetical protein